MLHKEFWGLVFLSFVVWIFIAGTPEKRIENACRPIGWGGNVITSLSALVMPNQQQATQSWFNKMEYGCRYLTWRLFYQDAYNAFIAEKARQESNSGRNPNPDTTGGVTAPAIQLKLDETPASSASK